MASKLVIFSSGKIEDKDIWLAVIPEGGRIIIWSFKIGIETYKQYH